MDTFTGNNKWMRENRICTRRWDHFVGRYMLQHRFMTCYLKPRTRACCWLIPLRLRVSLASLETKRRVSGGTENAVWFWPEQRTDSQRQSHKAFFPVPGCFLGPLSGEPHTKHVGKLIHGPDMWHVHTLLKRDQRQRNSICSPPTSQCSPFALCLHIAACRRSLFALLF